MSAEELHRVIFGGVPTVVIYVRRPDDFFEEACRWVRPQNTVWPAVGEQIVFTDTRIAQVRTVRHVVNEGHGNLEFINIYTDWL